MASKNLTINHADGSSETYTINRDEFTGVRQMTVDGQTVNVDHTPEDRVRYLNVGSEVVTRSKEVFVDERSMQVDGSTVDVKRKQSDVYLTEAEYEALTEYEDRKYIVEGVGEYQGAQATSKEDWTYEAEDLHVAKTGDDSTGDGSFANPYLTISKGYDVALAAGGKTVWVHEGTYAEDTGVGYFLKSTDNPASELKVIARPDQTVVWTNVSGAYVIRLNAANSNLTFRGFEVRASSNVTAFVNSSGSTASLTDVKFIECDFVDDQATATAMNLAGGAGNSNVQIKRCSFSSTSRFGNVLNNHNGFTFVGNTVSCPSSDSSHYTVRLNGTLEGVFNLSSNNITINGGTAIKQDAVFVGSAVVNCNRNVITGATVDCILFEGGSGSHDCEIYVNNNNINTSVDGIVVDANVTKGSAVGNTVVSAGDSCLAYPADGETGPVTDVDISANNVSATGAVGHGILVGINGSDIRVLENVVDASGGGWYGLVLKGDNNKVFGNNFSGGQKNALLVKGCSNSVIKNNKIEQRVNTDSGAGCLDFAVNGTGDESHDNVITHNTFEVTDGKLVAWSVGEMGANNVVDYNTYSVSGSGTWGVLFGDTLTSLSDLQTSYADNYSVNNDLNSVQV